MLQNTIFILIFLSLSCSQSKTFTEKADLITFSLYKGDVVAAIAGKEEISEILQAVNNAVETEDHKCADIGTIELKKGSETWKFSILPSHNGKEVELRFNGKIYKVSRELFFTNSIKKFEDSFFMKFSKASNGK